MALNYNTLQALINEKYLPVLYDQIFTDNHFLWATLKKKAKTYNERKIVVPLEYAKSTNIDFTSRYQTLATPPIEVATAAEYTPKMLTGALTVALEDELENMSEMSIKNVLSVKMNNLKRSIEEHLATHIWTRGVANPDANGYNTVDHLVNDDSSQSVGGISDTTALASWWMSNMVDVTGADFSDNPALESDLTDPTKDVYLKKLLQIGVGKAKFQSGRTPDIIVVPQYIWDLLEFILDPQKTGTKMNVKAGSMGFTALDFRDIPIVADDDMVAAQTGGTDGRMYFINTEFLYMFFNSGAKFKASEFVRPANANSKTSLVNAYGNMCISNRQAHCVMENIKSPKTYVN